jgi:hypothetical protein
MSLIKPVEYTDLSDANTYTFPQDALEYELKRRLRQSHETIHGVNSAFNYWRGQLPPFDVWDITLRFLNIQATAAAMDTEMDNVNSKLLKAGKLWLELDDTSKRYIICEPKERPEIKVGRGQVRHIPYIVKLTGFGFQQSETLTQDSEAGISASPHTWNIVNGGNAYIYDAIFTLTALSNNGFTANVVLENLTTGESITVARSSVATNDALVIDCGKGTVKFNGADDWANVTLGTTQRPMISVAPGTNNMRLTIGGTPDADLDIDYREQWL